MRKTVQLWGGIMAFLFAPFLAWIAFSREISVERGGNMLAVSVLAFVAGIAMILGGAVAAWWKRA